MVDNSANFDPIKDDVFERIAEKYDFLCDIFSLGAHRLWKRTMVAAISVAEDAYVLDAASGTGDIAIRLAKRWQKERNTSTIVASDICPAMLSIAKAKAEEGKIPVNLLTFQSLDAHNLESIPDNSVDIYSLSFAMKICDRNKLVPEAMRVLRPGGQLYCLEASRIPVPAFHWLYLKYMEWCIPVIARIATKGDRSSHDYLLKGIHEMPDQNTFKAELEGYGFEDVSHKSFSLGIVALHRAHKPK